MEPTEPCVGLQGVGAAFSPVPGPPHSGAGPNQRRGRELRSPWGAEKAGQEAAGPDSGMCSDRKHDLLGDDEPAGNQPSS